MLSASTTSRHVLCYKIPHSFEFDLIFQSITWTSIAVWIDFFLDLRVPIFISSGSSAVHQSYSFSFSVKFLWIAVHYFSMQLEMGNVCQGTRAYGLSNNEIDDMNYSVSYFHSILHCKCTYAVSRSSSWSYFLQRNKNCSQIAYTLVSNHFPFLSRIRTIEKKQNMTLKIVSFALCRLSAHFLFHFYFDSISLTHTGMSKLNFISEFSHASELFIFLLLCFFCINWNSKQLFVW